jgi:hypothetical protein
MIGVMALFDSRDALLAAMAAATRRRIAPLTAFAPAYDEQILRASSARRSSVAAWTLAGGTAGALTSLAFTIWTARRWPALIVGGKPLIAWPPLLIIAFVLTILCAAIAAVAACVVGGWLARRGTRAAYDPSLSDARFGLLIACSRAHLEEMTALLIEHGAATWRVV